MKKPKTRKHSPALLDVVALLEPSDTPALVRGQVGTVVELLDAAHVLVEFSDDEGRAYAIEPFPTSRLLVLHYVADAA